MIEGDVDPETRAALQYQSDLLRSVTAESEPALEKLIKDTFLTLYPEEGNRKKLLMVADLNLDQLSHIFKLVVADTCYFKQYAKPGSENYDHFQNLTYDLLALSVSRGRKGRTEGVEIAASIKEKIREDILKHQTV